MDQDTINTLTRRGIRELSPRAISNDEIENMTIYGVHHIGMRIKRNNPSYYHTRKSATSYTNVFAWPSGCIEVLRVWDMMTTAVSITGAADNGSGEIRITVADHGVADDGIVVIHDVGGTTEANDTWLVTYVDDDTLDLDGSTFTNTYTSGGKLYEPPRNPPKIEKLSLEKVGNSNSYGWYPRGKNIVVDNKSFENDIIVDYDTLPTAITDIPTEYHMGLVAWNVIRLIKIPKEDDPKFYDMISSYKEHKDLLQVVMNSLDQSFQMSAEPTPFPEGINLENYL